MQKLLRKDLVSEKIKTDLEKKKKFDLRKKEQIEMRLHTILHNQRQKTQE